jgi:hypothetical protein
VTKINLMDKIDLSEIRYVVEQAAERGTYNALVKSGHIKSWISFSKAQRDYGFTRRQIENGVKDGRLRAVRGEGKNSKINILREDLDKYREYLISINKFKSKQNDLHTRSKLKST